MLFLIRYKENMERHIGGKARKIAQSEIPDAEDQSFNHDCALLTKRMITYLFERELARQGISRAELAHRMGTSRAVVNRMLDPTHESLTLQTLQKAAEALGRTVVIDLR